jgi:transcriptional regulator with XRE-family HTH domain
VRVPGVEIDPDRGARIREARLVRHLTIKELAERVGVSERTIWSWEQGGKVTGPNLRALAHDLAVSRDFLLGEETSEIVNPLEQRISELEQRLDARLGQVEQQLGRAVEHLSAGIAELATRPPEAGEADTRREGRTQTQRSGASTGR